MVIEWFFTLQEKLDSMDFKNLVEVSFCDPEKPKPLSDTPLTFINTASDLVKLVSKLSQEHEIAVSPSVVFVTCSSTIIILNFFQVSSVLASELIHCLIDRSICLFMQVDLEHHTFRSFQGFTCLIQISTRTEDFIIDTLDLRHLIGPLLHKIFSNESIQKVKLAIFLSE